MRCGERQSRLLSQTVGGEYQSVISKAFGEPSEKVETTSSLLKVLGEEKIARLVNAAEAEKGDAVLIVAGRKSIVAASLGALRNEIARRENLIPKNVYKPLWVTEFPMFEYNEETGNYDAMHHPFT